MQSPGVCAWGDGAGAQEGRGLAVGNGIFGRTVGGEHLEWRWGDSWQQQLERQLELGRGAGLEDSRVGQCGLAGSPWTLSGSEGWSWGGPAGGQGQLPPDWLGQAQGCLGPTSGPGGRAEGCSCQAACAVAPLPPSQPFRGHLAGLGQFPGGGRIPRAVAMGMAEQHHWLEYRQAGSLTSDCQEDSTESPAGGG